MTPQDLIRRNAEAAFKLHEAQAHISMEIERQFIHKDGGLNYIMAQAYAEAVDALVKMIDADPNDVDGMQKLQNEVRRYGDMCFWMHDAVQRGAQAYRLLQQTDVVDGWDDTFVARENEDG